MEENKNKDIGVIEQETKVEIKIKEKENIKQATNDSKKEQWPLPLVDHFDTIFSLPPSSTSLNDLNDSTTYDTFDGFDHFDNCDDLDEFDDIFNFSFIKHIQFVF